MPESVTITIEPVAEMSWQLIRMTRFDLMIGDDVMREVSHNTFRHAQPPGPAC
jgi:hypothetical protein